MEILKIDRDDWTQTSSQVFWGEIAPCDHVVQIYENDDVFLDLLNGFVGGGISTGDSVVVIATAMHLKALHTRLESAGFIVAKLQQTNQYIPLDAEETLSRFMVNDWPDENLFNQVVTDLISRAKSDRRQVRAFGEMVAILWAKGQIGATVRLEHLWNKFCENEAFCLFCAYPQIGFTGDASESVMHICGAHSKMITGVGKGKTDLLYKSINSQTG
jgi:hypothetical protein